MLTQSGSQLKFNIIYINYIYIHWSHVSLTLLHICRQPVFSLNLIFYFEEKQLFAYRRVRCH